MKSPEQIIGEVALITGVPVAAITGKRKSRRITHARFLAIAAVRENHDWWTLDMIGDLFNRDHSTIFHAVRRHQYLLSEIPAYQAMAAQLTEDLSHA